MDKNISIHISDRGYVNISLNIYSCGNMDIAKTMKNNVDHYSLYYVHQGAATLQTHSFSGKIEKGYIFAIFPNEDFLIKSISEEELNITWIDFSGHQVENYLERGGISKRYPIAYDKSDCELENMFENIMKVARMLPNRYCKICANLYNVFAFLIDNKHKISEPEAYSGEYYLLRALDFIDIYYNDKISIEKISEHLGITRKYLYNIFKKYTDISPKDYIVYYRMEKASKLLLEGNITVESVASLVGYLNQFHFAKEFKKIVGKTPTEYRNEVKKGELLPYVSPINRLK